MGDAAGGKLWRRSYRLDGKEKVMSLGQYPYTTLAARNLLAKGADPMAQRRAEKTATRAASEHSFQSVAMKWVEHWHHEKIPRHVAHVKRRMEADILPCLGPRPIAEIEAPEIKPIARSPERAPRNSCFSVDISRAKACSTCMQARHPSQIGSGDPTNGAVSRNQVVTTTEGRRAAPTEKSAGRSAVDPCRDRS
jgi:hypothetical protein